ARLMPVNRCVRLVAQAALGLVDDPLEGEVVRRLIDQAKIGNRVADFRALVEAKAAHDLVGEADGDEPLLELAGLELSANEDGSVVERAAAAQVGLDLFADPARFLWGVPDADHLNPIALVEVGPQRLAEAAGIVGDKAGGGGEDVRGGSVVLLEPNHLRAREILLEAENVGDFGPAPRIDRLVVIADAAQVAMRLGQQLQPVILRSIGVLIFVDQYISEPLAIAV